MMVFIDFVEEIKILKYKAFLKLDELKCGVSNTRMLRKTKIYREDLKNSCLGENKSIKITI